MLAHSCKCTTSFPPDGAWPQQVPFRMYAGLAYSKRRHPETYNVIIISTGPAYQVSCVTLASRARAHWPTAYTLQTAMHINLLNLHQGLDVLLSFSTIT